MRTTVLAVGAVVLLMACAPEPIDITVTLPGPPEVLEGAEVRYQGVVVGRVTAVALDQPDPNERGTVELAIRIDPGEIVLREADAFEVAKDDASGAMILRVLPAEEDSPPLEPGARIAGRPSLEVRVEVAAEEGLDEAKRLALEQAEILADTISEQIDFGIPPLAGYEADAGEGPPEGGSKDPDG